MPDIWTVLERKDKELAEAADLRAKYNELLMAVGRKHEGETRHQTALRYIRQAEEVNITAEAAGDAS